MYIFTILLVSISTVMFAQTNDSMGTWIVKADASALIDITTFPTIQLSGEKKFAKHFSVNVEAGVQVYDFHLVDTAFLKPKGFRLNMETRWYLSTFFHSERSSKKIALYVGFQPYFRKNQFNKSIEYYSKPDSTTMKVDNLGVKKTTYGFNCLYGFQRPISKRIIIELYTGRGINKGR